MNGPAAMSARFGYPVFLDLHGVPALVVGGGPVAARKIAGLLAAGAVVTVVAPHVTAEIEEARRSGSLADLRPRTYVPSDLTGVRLVVTATGVELVDRVVAADATAAGIWVNAADRPDHCSFILPAIARNGPLSIAVSTDGSSPALAGGLRDRAAALLGDDVVILAERLAARRAAIRATGGSTEDHDWNAEIDAVLGSAEQGQE